MTSGTEVDWRWLQRVVGPTLALVPSDFLDEVACRLAEAGVRVAVRRHDSRPIYDWVCTFIGLQGVSDERAWAWDAAWGRPPLPRSRPGSAADRRVRS